jgi:8-oxo-dGTP pyrophosphatase MutT (NUDIX family)
MNLQCFRKCCSLRVLENNNVESYYSEYEGHSGAGVCVITPKGVLVSQSHNLYWGFPKGLQEEGESILDCALRELLEETGVYVEKEQLKKFVFSFRYKNITRKVSIFFLISDGEKFQCNPLNILNDSTGFGFIQPICLLELYYSGTIKVNYFTRIILKIIFGI